MVRRRALPAVFATSRTTASCAGTTATGALSDFRKPSNHANGLARDRQGRLLACEHGTRRVTRTEYDGRITVLADRFDGKRLNSPNDIVCPSDGSIWFTDPPFGILGWWEGEPATPELPHGVYRIDPATRRTRHGAGRPAGQQRPGFFSPDEKILYVVESRARSRTGSIWAYDVAGATLKNKRLYVDAGGPGAFDGIAVDQFRATSGAAWAAPARPAAATEEVLDGVRVYDRDGRPLAHIHAA